jgi:hypothetical protein
VPVKCVRACVYGYQARYGAAAAKRQVSRPAGIPIGGRHAFRPMASSVCAPWPHARSSWRGLHAFSRPTGLAWQRCQPGHLPPPHQMARLGSFSHV